MLSSNATEPGIWVLPLHSDKPSISIGTMGLWGPGNAPGAGELAHIKTDRVKGVYPVSVNSRAREARESQEGQARRLVWAPQPQ